MTKVSVIAGIYYPPEICFRRFIDSCLNQTLDNMEFIFIFDSPNDIKSREIINEYKSQIDNNKNKFIIIENEENLGVEKTYNKGIDLSTGKYIIIVDSDDFFDNDLLEIMYNYMISHKNIEFLAPRILIGYVDKFDILFNILGNDNPDDTGIMFTKETLNKHKKYFRVNLTSIKDLDENAICDILPLSIGSFYYYIRSNENATNSDVFLDKDYSKEKNVEFDLYIQIVKNELNTTFKMLTSKDINIDDYSKEQLIEMALPYINLDKSGENNFSYEDLKKI